MVKRKIIKIDEEKCNGCGQCIPNCPEGALQVIDGKARLISDLFCDGLGACIGHCPLGAIRIEERDAEPYDERKVMGNIVKQGENTIKAHLEHLKEHGEAKLLKEAIDFLKDEGIEVPIGIGGNRHDVPCSCPGSKMIEFSREDEEEAKAGHVPSQLRQWPVQLHLVGPGAPYFENADLLIAADCVPFAYANFHGDFLGKKAVVIACPKLDDTETYVDKLAEIMRVGDVKSVTVVHMEVPCCFGLQSIVEEAVDKSGKKVPVEEVTITVRGEKQGA